jgi:subtilisin family serine protease
MKPAPETKRRPALAASLAAPDERLRLEACEQRLVLSAQLLSELIPHNALAPIPASPPPPVYLEQHGMLEENQACAPLGVAPPLEHQSAAAHQLTGWNQVQQQFGLNGRGQTVVVIDSGIAWDHIYLGKGFGAGYRVVGGWDFAENDANPYDDAPAGFHGTHVAGIIGSDHPARSGVAPGVDLVALRVFDDAGKGRIEWVEQALQWVYDNRNTFANPITTVNLSLGTQWNSNAIPGWATLEEELKQLYQEGIVVTASAGNSFKQYNTPGLSYPAASSYVLPVASVDDNGQLSDFTQRSGRVLAAPGRNILSTVPDHVLGRDGRVDDFSIASGTSMAAPYVAGASVLVREAMEMAGVSPVSAERIIQHLYQTADNVFDAVTNATYQRLNLQQAIDTLLPDDDVGDTSATARTISLAQRSLSGWVNTLGDVDVYRFTPDRSGRLTLDADSHWVESLKWDVSAGGQALASGGLDPRSLQLTAGTTYELRMSAGQEIGPWTLGMQFVADTAPTPVPVTPAIQLGTIDYFEQTVAAGSTYRAVAQHDGLFSIQWNNPDQATGSLQVRDARGVTHADTTWENGQLRLDIPATAGQAFDIQLPGPTHDTGQLVLGSVLRTSGSELTLRGTQGSDALLLDLSSGIKLGLGALAYSFPAGQFTSVRVDGGPGNDALQLIGSQLADKVDLQPGLTTLENSQLNVRVSGVEQVAFDGSRGGPDRVYLYDSDGDDRLVARPRNVELDGAGYRFTVKDVDRIFVHATGAGNDEAFLYDSAGNDRLSVRPQFTSMTGDNFFFSVRGFERVYAYATAGGYDRADLYDSAGDDRFATSGEAASIVGPGFFSYTRFFEEVHAHATAGGNDTASLYGSSQHTAWLRGSDFVSFQEAAWDRTARGFSRIDTYVSGQLRPDAAPLLTQSGPPELPSVVDLPEVGSTPAPSAPSLQAWLPADALLSTSALPSIDGFASAGASRAIEQDAAGLFAEVLDLRRLLAERIDEGGLAVARDPRAERDLLDQLFEEFGEA